jgi:hypothetical protein
LSVITLYPDRPSNTWLARFHDDPEVKGLFGDDVLPTAYTLAMPGAEVRREVQARNPGARVRLVELDGTTHED